MPKIDLITGFLGSGKTTFLKRYAGYLMREDQNIAVLENDFGAVNVDTMLLQELQGEQCELEMVAGGCDYDCHRRRFKTKLIAMGMVGYDRVLVEPSGIYDTDEFFDVLCEEPLDAWYNIGSVIAVVDASLEENLSEEAEYLLASQIAVAGMVVFSRTQDCAPGDLDRTVAHLNRVMERFSCRRRFSLDDGDILAKDWNELTDEDFVQLCSAGYHNADFVKLPVERDNGFMSLYYMHVRMTPEQLQRAIQAMFADPACGGLFRVKGFLAEQDGWLQINATRESMHLDKVSAGQEVIILIGEGLKQEQTDQYLGRSAGVL